MKERFYFILSSIFINVLLNSLWTQGVPISFLALPWRREADKRGAGGGRGGPTDGWQPLAAVEPPPRGHWAQRRPLRSRLWFWCWCFRIDLWHSAVRHPALTMTQACGPNTPPSCFWLLSGAVRTSGHVTRLWQMKLGGGVCPHQTQRAVVIPKSSTPDPPPPLTHTHAKALCC